MKAELPTLNVPVSDRAARPTLTSCAFAQPEVFAALLLVLLLACLPLLSSGSFGLSRYIVALCYLIAAVGLNLAMGYAGEFALGHPVIMAVGAYAAGILSAKLGWPPSVTVPFGVVVGMLSGLLIMSPGLRVRGWYYSLITMFAVLVLPRLVSLAEPLTGGVDGLTGVKAPTFFGFLVPNWLLFEFTLACLVLTWLMTDNLMRSAWGYRLRALRDARHAAASVGINLTTTRLAVYLLSSAPPAIAGVILAYNGRFVSADMFGINLMLMLLSGIVLGGGGSRWGPLLGMTPLLFLSLWVGPFSLYNSIVLGIGILVCTLLFPDGIVSLLSRRVSARHRSVEGLLEERRDRPIEVAAPRPPDWSGDEEPIVRVEGLKKRFGGNTVLDGVNLEIHPRALYGLVGPNGSGKSTFLNVLSGFLQPDEGLVEIGGADHTGFSAYRVARGGVGRTFQVPQLIEEYTTLENIEVGLILTDTQSVLASALRTPSVRRAATKRRARAMATFDLLGLPDEVLDIPASSLPLGLKRLVEVGRAIVADPKLILLDEPAAGLNDQERLRLGKLMVRLKSIGMTVLVVEHNVPFMLEFCDELVLLENGSVSCRAKLGEQLPDRLVAYLGHRPTLAKQDA